MFQNVRAPFYRIGLSVYRFFRRRRRSGRSARQVLDNAVFLASQQADMTPLPAPFVSLVVPVYNTPPAFLDDLVASVRQQRPGAWQLVLSDDGSTASATRAWLDRHAGDGDLTIVLNARNGGIAAATNAGLAAATAPWIGLLDHDDALAPHALDRIYSVLERHPECLHLYTDEVITDVRLRPLDIFLKPAFDPVLLSGVNYVNHLSLYRRDRLAAIGGLRTGYDGAQDYDLVLRYTAGLEPGRSLHLPYPAYLWRRDGASFSARHRDRSADAARKALAEAYAAEAHETPAIEDALGGKLHRIRFDAARRDWPLVSVIVPNLDAFKLISTVLDGLTERTDYPALEIVVVDNGSTDPRVLALYEERRQGAVPFRAEIRPEPFNFSRSINRGVGSSRGEFVLLLNNDIEMLDPNWLREMVACALAWPDTAIVGAKLLYPGRKLQHAGVIAGLGGYAGHWYIGMAENFPGPMGRLWVRQSLSVVTGACMLVKRAAFDELGPFDEERFAIAYNDVDFCLRAVAAGKRVVWTPFATLLHHESASRGSDDTVVNAGRFLREKANLVEAHATDRFEDRAFNPWYTTHLSFPGHRALESLPGER
jgi:GT2 family glycosyltransferase